MKFKAFFLLITVLIATNGFSQEESDDSVNLKSQFQDLKKESNNYQIYKVVKEARLDEFWSSVADTLKVNQDQIQSLETEVNGLNGQVEELHGKVSERDTKLTDQEFNIEHMTFLGMALTKSTYVTFTWTIIFILLIIAIVLFFRFRSANTITVRTRKEFILLQEEFEAQKKKARETESRIKRDLQTEINQVVDLKAKLGEE